ncbi:MAG TPA: hypothetical protein VKW09_08330 [bacterium]|nr:hypothetical protein [bacterium]
MLPRTLRRLSRRFGSLRYHLLLPAALLAAIATVMMHSVAAQSPYDCAGWSARIDRTPGPGAIPTLHVQGGCTFRFTGYSAELRPQLPPGADPNVVLLDLVVHAPAGLATPGAGGTTLSYTTSVTSSYETVLLLPDHIVVPVHQAY